MKRLITILILLLLICAQVSAQAGPDYYSFKSIASWTAGHIASPTDPHGPDMVISNSVTTKDVIASAATLIQLETTNATITGALSVQELQPENFACPGLFVLGTTTPDLGSGTRTFIQSPIQWSCPTDTNATYGVSVGNNLIILSSKSTENMERWYKAYNTSCRDNIVIGDNYKSVLPALGNSVIGAGNCSYGGASYNIVNGFHNLPRGSQRNIVIGDWALYHFTSNNFGNDCIAIGTHVGNRNMVGVPGSLVGRNLTLLGGYTRVPVATSSYYLNLANVMRGYTDTLSGEAPQLDFYPYSPAGAADLTTGDAAIRAMSLATDVAKIYTDFSVASETRLASASVHTLTVLANLIVNTLSPTNFSCPGTFVVGTLTPDLASGSRTFIRSPIQWSNPISGDAGREVGNNLVIDTGTSNTDFGRWDTSGPTIARCRHNTVIGVGNYSNYTPDQYNTVVGTGNCGYGGVGSNIVFGQYCASRGGVRNTIMGYYALARGASNNFIDDNIVMGYAAGGSSMEGVIYGYVMTNSDLCLYGNNTRVPAATSSYYLNINNQLRGYYSPSSGEEPRLDIYPCVAGGDLTAGDSGVRAMSLSTYTVTIDVLANLKPQALPAVPVAGDLVIDSGDSNKLKHYDGTVWQTGSGGGGVAIESGSSSFAGNTASRTITITAQADLLYKVFTQGTENSAGKRGEVWVEKLSTTTFAVHNAGVATTTFDWEVIP